MCTSHEVTESFAKRVDVGVAGGPALDTAQVASFVAIGDYGRDGKYIRMLRVFF